MDVPQKDAERFSREAAVRAGRTAFRDFAIQTADRVVDLITRASLPTWERGYVLEAPVLAPVNPVSGCTYSGYNRMALTLYLMQRGLHDPRFLTLKQANSWGREHELNMHVQAGEKATLLLRPILLGEQKSNQAVGQGEPAVDEYEMDLAQLALGSAPRNSGILAAIGGDHTQNRPRKPVYLLPYYVFHATQVANMPPPPPRPGVCLDGHQKIEALVAALGVRVDHGAAVPHYDPAADVIRMPHRGSFSSREAYFTTLLHECYHATGSSKREAREAVVRLERAAKDPHERAKIAWNDPVAAAEEVRADCFAAMMALTAGMQPHFEQTAAYIKAWVDRQGAKGDEAIAKEVARSAVTAVATVEALAPGLYAKAIVADWATNPPAKRLDTLIGLRP